MKKFVTFLLMVLALILLSLTTFAQRPSLLLFYGNCAKSKQDSIRLVISRALGVPVVSKVVPFPKEVSLDGGGAFADELITATAKYRGRAYDRVIGITSEKLYGPANPYGILWQTFGFSETHPPTAVISTRGVGGPRLVERMEKLALHEVTHTYGVDHCPNKKCLMREGRVKASYLDATPKVICAKCRKKAAAWVE